MSTLSERFAALGEPYAAAYFGSERGRFYRCAAGFAAWLDAAEPGGYDGGHFFPVENLYAAPRRMRPDLSFTWVLRGAPLPDGECEAALAAERALSPFHSGRHTVAGWCYTHSVPNYARVMEEGLNAYLARVRRMQDADMRDGLEAVILAADRYRARCVTYLRTQGAPDSLIRALERVPMEPARDIWEALVCRNFVYYLDGCDNPGRIDADILPFWKGEDITDLLRELFVLIDRTGGYSGSVGPEYNPLTAMCLRAIRGLRRPSLELRVTPDMPEALWDLAEDDILCGTTNPALYNEAGYDAALHRYYPDMPREDYLRWSGAGCTELTLEGLCHSGSLEAGMHLPLIFTDALRRDLESCGDFGAFYAAFLKRYRREWRETESLLQKAHRERAEYRPHPVRTLLTDDCIDRECDFNAGGARYNWSVVNFAGLVNAADSLLAVKTLVFDEKKVPAADFVRLLDAREPRFLADCRACPHLGAGDEAAGAFARRMTEDLFGELEKYRTWAGGRYLPASIQFSTCAAAGKRVPATPDGRAAGTPLADSIGTIPGKDCAGPTAMLHSAAAMDQSRMAGTPVLNLRLSRAHVKGVLRGLALGYFAEGGLQLQVNCVSREELIAAQKEPEKYGHLIVRVGGYSEYFVRLDADLQAQVMSRTEL